MSTVFRSPLPNPQLWWSGSKGFLQTYEPFVDGGWWHDPTILEATGDGVEAEEPRGWKGWWNEQVVRYANTAGTLRVLMLFSCNSPSFPSNRKML